MERESRPQAGDGFDDPLARGPSKPSHKSPSTQSALDPIRAFLPCRPESEYRLRHRIDRIAVMAASAPTRTTHGHARSIYWIANDLANGWRLRAASEQELIDVIHALAMVLAAARSVERTEAVDG